MARHAEESFDLSATATHYSYPGDPRPISYAYDELGLTLSLARCALPRRQLDTKLNLYSYTDGLARDHGVLSYEASLHRSLRSHFDLSVARATTTRRGWNMRLTATETRSSRGIMVTGAPTGLDLGAECRPSPIHARPAGGPLAASIAWAFSEPDGLVRALPVKQRICPNGRSFQPAAPKP